VSQYKWRRKLAGEKTGPHRPWINRVNKNWYDDFIMVWGGLLILPTEFVGNRWSKTMMQMGRACSSPEAEWNCQGEDGFDPWLGDMKGPSTTLQVEFVVYLIDTNLALIVTWGEFS
jgi:hypothetical protein